MIGCVFLSLNHGLSRFFDSHSQPEIDFRDDLVCIFVPRVYICVDIYTNIPVEAYIVWNFAVYVRFESL